MHFAEPILCHWSILPPSENIRKKIGFMMFLRGRERPVARNELNVTFM